MRGSGSADGSNGAGSSGSVSPKPSSPTRPGAAARASAVEKAASSNPQPQRLRARMRAGPYPQGPMRTAPAILARGPWAPDHVEARWSDEHYAPPPDRAEAADAALAARLVRHEETDGRLLLDLQPVRWALRLVEGDASCSVAAMCLARDSAGR